MSILKSFKTTSTSVLVAAALTLQEYLSPNRKEGRFAEEMVETEPQEVADQWEALMEAYLDPEHEDHQYASRVMTAEQHNDPQGVKLRNEAFFSTVTGKPSKSGTGGKKWWENRSEQDVELEEARIRELVRRNLLEQKQKQLAEQQEKAEENNSVKADITQCDYCLELAEQTDWAAREAVVTCDECGVHLCGPHARGDFLDYDSEGLCYYCSEPLEMDP